MKALPLVFLLCGCKLFLPAPEPMRSVFDAKPGHDQAKCLVVLFPGAGDIADTFREQGFVEAVQKSGASADVIAANATMGYYFRGTVAQRVEADVLGPVREKGQYEQVWLAGISMGGFGVLHYTQFFPQHVDGILSLAPYLGSAALTDEIRAAGGLAKWTPDAPAPIEEDNYQRQLWSWLHRVTAGAEPGPALYLGYGDDDDRGGQKALLAAALPAGHVLHAPGGHDWPPWRSLFQQFLETSEFKARCR